MIGLDWIGSGSSSSNSNSNWGSPSPQNDCSIGLWLMQQGAETSSTMEIYKRAQRPTGDRLACYGWQLSKRRTHQAREGMQRCCHSTSILSIENKNKNNSNGWLNSAIFSVHCGDMHRSSDYKPIDKYWFHNCPLICAGADGKGGKSERDYLTRWLHSTMRLHCHSMFVGDFWSFPCWTLKSDLLNNNTADNRLNALPSLPCLQIFRGQLSNVVD